MKLKNYEIVGQPDRIRGTDTLLINVKGCYEEDGQERTFSFTVTSNQTDDVLINEEIQKKLLVNIPLKAYPETLIIEAAKLGGERAIAALDEDRAKEMAIMCTDKQQGDITRLCNELMLDSIDVSDMNIGSFHCLANALKKLLPV